VIYAGSRDSTSVQGQRLRDGKRSVSVFASSSMHEWRRASLPRALPGGALPFPDVYRRVVGVRRSGGSVAKPPCLDRALHHSPSLLNPRRVSWALAHPTHNHPPVAPQTHSIPPANTFQLLYLILLDHGFPPFDSFDLGERSCCHVFLRPMILRRCPSPLPMSD